MTYHSESRERLIAFFCDHGDQSFSLEEVCERLLEDGKGKSTLYRQVSSLVEEGILRKIADQSSRHCTYQYVGDEHCTEHLHLKCVQCGRLIHLDEQTSHTLEKQIFSSEHFTLDESTILFGECNNCRKKK